MALHPHESAAGAAQPAVRRRSAIITGGTRNIGRAIALALAQQGVACTVASRRFDDDARATLDALEARGVPGQHCVADVTQESEVNALVDQAAQRFGAVDALIHCAALRRVTALADITLSEWREVLATNLDAAFLCSRAALPHFPADGGRIVFIAGVSAFVGVPQRAHVIASKMALVGLARALATELADRRITVNCVSPGLIDTQRGPDAGQLPHHSHPPRLPLDRRGTPDEVAAAVRLLVSDDGAYITGQVVHVNGGLYYG